MTVTSLGTGAVRRAQIAAQGLARRRPDSPGRTHVARTLDRTRLLQIDSVNVLARAHLLPVYSRLGPYPVATLDRALSRSPRLAVETFCHEASYVPPRTYALLAHRRERAETWFLERRRFRDAPLAEVLDAVAHLGPVTASRLHDHLGHARAEKEAWGWNHSPLKDAVTLAWRTGRLAVVRRNASFEQVLDLPDRVLPTEALAPAPPPADASRELVATAARALGVASAASLADYHRMAAAPTLRAVAELVEDGELIEVRTPGQAAPAYLHADAVVPRRVTARALLAPFDPLVFDRPRLLSGFGMHYRIGIYTPRERRTHGYYVLPFLLGEHLVARVDLKADRAADALLVQEAHAEDPAGVPGVRTRGPSAWPAAAEIVRELTAELVSLADWLGLSAVTVPARARGDVADLVRADVGRAARER